MTCLSIIRIDSHYLSHYIHCSLCLYVHFQFVHEQALTCELAAYFYLEIGDVNKAGEYCLRSYERYSEWVSTLR
jgi:hypothetical protein